MNKMKKDFDYEVKCRKCGKTTKMWFGSDKDTTRELFLTWVGEHSTFPIQKQCDCDSGSMMFHDLIAYGNVLNII